MISYLLSYHDHPVYLELENDLQHYIYQKSHTYGTVKKQSWYAVTS